jgi:hypothetical protein
MLQVFQVPTLWSISRPRNVLCVSEGGCAGGMGLSGQPVTWNQYLTNARTQLSLRNNVRQFWCQLMKPECLQPALLQTTNRLSIFTLSWVTERNKQYIKQRRGEVVKEDRRTYCEGGWGRNGFILRVSKLRPLILLIRVTWKWTSYNRKKQWLQIRTAGFWFPAWCQDAQFGNKMHAFHEAKG